MQTPVTFSSAMFKLILYIALLGYVSSYVRHVLHFVLFLESIFSDRALISHRLFETAYVFGNDSCESR